MCAHVLFVVGEMPFGRDEIVYIFSGGTVWQCWQDVQVVGDPNARSRVHGDWRGAVWRVGMGDVIYSYPGAIQ